jgi:hypothetical protein
MNVQGDQYVMSKMKGRSNKQSAHANHIIHIKRSEGRGKFLGVKSTIGYHAQRRYEAATVGRQ